MKELEEIARLKERIADVEILLNSGDFISDALVGQSDEVKRKAVSRYREVREKLLFEHEQFTDAVEAIKPQLKQRMINEDHSKAREGNVRADLRKRTTYKGSDAEQVLRDNGLLDAALASGAITYPATVNAKALTEEMKEAIECVAKVSHSITIK